jgi:hypothetical protein
MLTLFSVPKPFRGHIKVIQMNALQSWAQLTQPCEILLFGDDEGIAEAASRFNAHHIPKVSRNKYGTPLLDDVFLKAQKSASYGVMCYVNADIILTSDIVKAIEYVQERERVFLMAGRRWNIDLSQPLDFSQSDWQERLRALVLTSGKPMPPEGIDYFVFPRGFYRDLLPFTLGRAWFDNWLLWKARSLGGPIIDASETVMVVHQNHDYSHLPQGKNGAEEKRNRELMGGLRHRFTLSDATYRLTPAGLRLNLRRYNLVRIVYVRGIACLFLWLMIWTRDIGCAMGLRNSDIDRFFETMKKGIDFFRYMVRGKGRR